MKPRRRGYTHRKLIVIIDGQGVTEAGEVVGNLPVFAATAEPHIWVTMDAAYLYQVMEERFGNCPWYQRRAIDSMDPEMPEGMMGHMSKCRLESFGFDRDRARQLGIRIKHEARHVVWDVPRMFSDPHIAADKLHNTPTALLQFAQDVRGWCKDQDIPLRSTLAGLAGSLLRDERFWPHLRGSVPKATNERVREHLPGVYHERLYPTHTRVPAAVTIDQRRAYHRAAQEVPTPDPTTLYARGYFNDPENAPNLWANRDTDLYRRTLSQPGLVAVRASVLQHNKHASRPPALDRLEKRVDTLYLWTNEVQLCEEQGTHILGIVAAWTSLDADTGLPKYAAWCETQLDQASDYRQFWLKPTLHSLYGLLGARPRIMLTGMRLGKGDPEVWGMMGIPMPVRVTRFEGRSRTVNVAMLGTLQAEIRARSIRMANELRQRKIQVYHIHADGLHVGTEQLPFLPHTHWTTEPISNLSYEDNVSWLSDERDVLPGRDTRVRIETRRHHAKVLIDRANASSTDHAR